MLHLDGFDQFSGETNVKPALERAGYTCSGELTVTSGRAAGSYGITSTTGKMERKHPWSGDKFTFGFGCRFTGGRGAMAWLKAPNGEELIFWLDPDNGLPYISSAQGGALPIKNTWYYYELTLDRSDSKIELAINNRVDMARGISPTFAAATEITVGMGHRDREEYMVHPTPDNSVKVYDDIYIHEGDRKGPMIITTRFPTTDQHIEWYNTNSPDSSASTLSNRPPDPNDQYVAANVMDAQDNFTSSTQLPSDNPILATAVVALTRKSPSLDAKLRVFLGGGTVEGAAYRDQVHEVDSEWKLKYACFDRDTGDTRVGMEAAPFGIQVAS